MMSSLNLLIIIVFQNLIPLVSFTGHLDIKLKTSVGEYSFTINTTGGHKTEQLNQGLINFGI